MMCNIHEMGKRWEKSGNLKKSLSLNQIFRIIN